MMRWCGAAHLAERWARSVSVAVVGSLCDACDAWNWKRATSSAQWQMGPGCTALRLPSVCAPFGVSSPRADPPPRPPHACDLAKTRMHYFPRWRGLHRGGLRGSLRRSPPSRFFSAGYFILHRHTLPASARQRQCHRQAAQMGCAAWMHTYYVHAGMNREHRTWAIRS